jgi:S-adenosylmethionine:tRNA-ribosyltransferase-isomerase (queuine synthetase)
VEACPALCAACTRGEHHGWGLLAALLDKGVVYSICWHQESGACTASSVEAHHAHAHQRTLSEALAMFSSCVCR